MDIVAAKGQTIETMAEWKRLYDSPRTKHQWKEHRSAYSVAEFILNRNGAEALRARVSDAIGETVQFERNTPEMEVRFDQFGRGRMHDLGISGKSASGKSVFVGVEAKVDEPFGAPVGESTWERRLGARRTRQPMRLSGSNSYTDGSKQRRLAANGHGHFRSRPVTTAHQGQDYAIKLYVSTHSLGMN